MTQKVKPATRNRKAHLNSPRVPHEPGGDNNLAVGKAHHGCALTLDIVEFILISLACFHCIVRKKSTVVCTWWNGHVYIYLFTLLACWGCRLQCSIALADLWRLNIWNEVHLTPDHVLRPPGDSVQPFCRSHLGICTFLRHDSTCPF